MDPRSAKESKQIVVLAFQFAVYRSIGLPIGSVYDGKPLFEDAVKYARKRMSEKDCPGFLRKGPVLAKIAVLLVLFAAAILITVLFASSASDDAILYAGYAAAAVAFVLSPLLFYLIWRAGFRKTRLAKIGEFAQLVRDLLD